ncbi:MAG: phospholipase D-like domain-containing protein, partial [Alphaproteobacteria bacterium]
MPILRQGRNCWRIARAERAAVLIDGDAYFRAIDDAFRRARRSILIVGWDFDGRIRLRPDDPEHPECLGPMLRSLVEANPGLHVRILVWSIAVVHTPSAPLALLIGDEWQDHPRITLRLDTTHPVYGSHHQKIVCIDDAVAFAGGLDLTIERWDTPRHASVAPARTKPDGTPYGPVHDIQMAVDGEAARQVSAIARDRWRVATGEALMPLEKADDPWPDGLRADFAETAVAIARSSPAWGERENARECIALTIDAIVSAERTVYIEAQYITATPIRKAIARALSRPDGPEIVVVVTRTSRSLLERLAMGANQERLVRRLRRTDRFGRLRVYYPRLSAEPGSADMMVHAKLVIVDDRFVRIGSSNLNNRSIGLDTELDLAIEAANEDERTAIAGRLDRLLAEHLDTEPQAVATA